MYQSAKMDEKIIIVLFLIASLCAGRMITEVEDEIEAIDKQMYADDEGNAQKFPKSRN